MYTQRDIQTTLLFIIATVLGAVPCTEHGALAQPAPVTVLNAPLAPRFQHLTIEDGLSQGMVTAIYQDRQGFMWFGTRDGLNRYDGYRFTVFRNNPFDSTSLSHNFITEIFEDSRGRLWVGTSNGLNCFDPATEKFRRFLHDPDDLNSLSANEISAISEAPAPLGREMDVTVLWIGTRNDGLNKLVLRETDHDFVRYEHEPDDPNSLRSNQIMDLLVDRSGVLWIGTLSGLCRYVPPHSLNGAANGGEEFVCYVREASELSGDFIDKCSALFESSDGAIWVGMKAGIARLAPGDVSPGYFKSYDFSTTTQWLTTVNEICEDRQGDLWLATFEGLFIFNPEEKTFRRVRHDPEASASLSFDGLNSIFRDRSDAIWIGTSGFGLNRWDPHAKQFQTYNSENLALMSENEFGVSILMEDRRGVVWFFAKRGWYLFNRKTGHLAHNPLNLPFNEVRALYEDHEGFVWITTANTYVFRYNRRSERIEKIFLPPDPENTHIYAIHQDDSGDMWFGSNSRLPGKLANLPVGRHALYRWHRDTEALSEYSIPIPESLTGGWLEIRRISQHRSGVFWLATNRGLFRFELDSSALKIFQNEPANPVSLSNNDVKTLLLDPLRPDRFLWLGTNGGGLSRMRRDDLTGEEFSHYTEEQGLPNNVIYGILADEAGNLWMSTNKGLSKAVVAPETREIAQFKNYEVRDGLQSNEFNTKAYCKNAAGEMLFGGIKGFTIFHPDSIRDNPYVPPVVFTDLQIGYQSVKMGQPGSPLQKTINTTETVTLAPKDNLVTFEFAALDYFAPEKNFYSYKLENFEENWSHPSHNRRATYTNLEPGRYVFRVRGSNDDGVWNETGAAIELIVTPPWWKTWWAYVLYVLLTAGLLYGLGRYELSRIRLKDRVKLEQLEAQKLQELDQVKSRFFANISHEFRTPLTLIMGQLESMKALLADAQLKVRLEMAWRNAQQLLRLINQLLDLSKLEAGRMELRAAYGNIVPLLQRLTSSFESVAGLKRIQLRFASASAEIKIYHEPEKIEKIMHNLLSNALKFTPEGGTVAVAVGSSSGGLLSSTVSATATASANCLVITVRDSGIGIPEEHLPHVFDRFYQADSSATREQEGTGIGLALTKELVELHGGEISVTSEEGFGATFVVRLPFAVANQSETEIAIAQDEELPVTSEQLSVISEQLPDSSIEYPASIQQSIDPSIQPHAASDKEVILIVEDNADLRSYLREHLEDRFQVCEASHGEDGLAKAQEQIPDLVITDVMMPKMDGYTFSKHLKSDEKTSHIPIIMLTAKAEEADKIAGLEIGVDDYLLKPFSSTELHARVRNLIEIRRRLRERFSQTMLIKPSEITVTPVDQKFLERLKTIVEASMEDETFGLPTLSAKAGLSERQLERKLKALINQTPNQFIRSMRLARAKQLLEQNAGTVSEIAYMVGFNNIPYFSRAFREAFGKPPSAVKGEG